MLSKNSWTVAALLFIRFSPRSCLSYLENTVGEASLVERVHLAGLRNGL